MNSKKYTLTTLFFLAITFGINNILVARSVYVVSDTGTCGWSDSYLRAYQISGKNLVYQTEYKIINKNAIGIAIDESEYGNFLFVTFEYSDEIELVNTKTMEYVASVIASGATNLAGIAGNVGKCLN